MTEPREWLEAYAEHGTESAFRALVDHYLGLVYGTALRRVGGDPHLAKDITQAVFLQLARKASVIAREAHLGGWLHRTTCHVTHTTLRTERRRIAREQVAASMSSDAVEDPREDTTAVAALLDDVIQELPEPDRQAVLLRFFEKRDLRSIGRALGSSEDAARMRIQRALDKLRDLLTRRGVTVSGAALMLFLTSSSLTAAPVGLAAGMAGGIATAASTSYSILAMTKTQLAILSSVAVIGLAVPLAVQHQNARALRQENAALRQQVQNLEEQVKRAAVPAPAPASLAEADRRELLQLRGQVGVLRDQVAQANRAAASRGNPSLDARPAPPDDSAAMEQFRVAGLVKMNLAKQSLLAFHLYADDHQGSFPKAFDQVGEYLGGAAKEDGNDPSRTFDIVFSGPLQAIVNPAQGIVLREREAVRGPDSAWYRAYGFADGHSELHRAVDGQFEAWEAERQVKLRPAAGSVPGASQ